MKKIFEGNISCKAILESNQRQCDCLYVDKKKRSKDFAYSIALAKKQNIPVKLVDRDHINQLASGNTHGGILLEATTKSFLKLQEAHGFLVYIDGLEDPYNLGSVCRTLYAAGCNGLILPKRDWTNCENIILKASAGAFEKLNIYMVENEEELITYLKKEKIELFSAYRNQARSIYDIEYPEDLCIAIGGALRGLSAKILSASNQNIIIEYGREFRNALDTSSAAAVIAFEITRQKLKKGR